MSNVSLDIDHGNNNNTTNQLTTIENLPQNSSIDHLSDATGTNEVISPVDHDVEKPYSIVSTIEESPYSVITKSCSTDYQQDDIANNEEQTNLNRSNTIYEPLPRSSDTVNRRISVCQLQKKRPKDNYNIAPGDSLIGFKDGVPGIFSHYRVLDRKGVKRDPVLNFNHLDEVDTQPVRPPRKNRTKSLLTTKIYDKVFYDGDDEIDYLTNTEMSRRESDGQPHVILSGNEHVETGVRMYDPKTERPTRPSSTVVLPLHGDGLSDSGESWGSNADYSSESDQEFYEVVGKPIDSIDSVASNYELVDIPNSAPSKKLPNPPLPPRRSQVFQNPYLDLEKEPDLQMIIEDEVQFLTLPPLHNDADDVQVKRYRIIKCIIENEKVYMVTLNRLVKEYEKPLYARKIISHDRIKVIFKHIHEIMQCHQLFNIALSDRISEWLTNDLIGDVLHASFSTSIILKAYSSFIHNFSFAMDGIKETCKLVPAFLSFLKNRAGLSSYYNTVKKTVKNHLNLNNTKQSLYDLMRQPLERIPQLVLLTQELTRITPISHPDHFPLQMALTQLECFSETLSEKKRDSLMKHKVRQLDNYCIGLKKSLFAKSRYYIRHDDMLLCTIEDGKVVKTKLRRLFMLNDLLICASVLTKPKKVKSLTYKKFKIKWCIPIHDVNVLDVGSGITVKSTNQTTTTIRYSHISSPRPGNGNSVKNLEDLQHDISVIGEIVGKVQSLRREYRFLDIKKVSRWYNDVKSLYERESELANMNWIELSVPAHDYSQKRIQCLFNVHSPDKRTEWYAEFDNVKLRLADNNNPGWFLQRDEVFDGESAVLRRTLPLLSNVLPIFFENKYKVQCSLEVSVATVSKPIMWVFSGNEHMGVITLIEMNMSLKPRVLESFVGCETRICCAERVVEEGARSLNPYLPNVSVWVGTMSGRILLFDPYLEDRHPSLATLMKDAVVSLKYCNQRVFAGLANGSLACFQRKVDGIWDVLNPILVCLGNMSVLCMTSAADTLWCGCGAKIFVINSSTLEITNIFEVESDEDKSAVRHLVAYGVGVWVSLKRSSNLYLYHTETFDQLQVISIASPIVRMKNDIGGRIQEVNPEKLYVTALMATEGLLWVGTDQGLILTFPLPRLGGIPKVNGHACVSFHAHEGAVKTLYAFKVQKDLSEPMSGEQTDARSHYVDTCEITSEDELELSCETPENSYEPHYFVIEPEQIKKERNAVFKSGDEEKSDEKYGQNLAIKESSLSNPSRADVFPNSNQNGKVRNSSNVGRLQIEDPPSDVFQEINTTLESDLSSSTPTREDSSLKDYSTPVGVCVKEEETGDNSLPILPPKQREISDQHTSTPTKTLEISPRKSGKEEEEEDKQMKPDVDHLDSSRHSEVLTTNDSTYDVSVELESNNHTLDYATVNINEIKEIIEQQQHHDQQQDESNNNNDDDAYDIPPAVSVEEKASSEVESYDIPPAVSVEVKASSEVESYDIPPAPTEDNSSSEGDSYDTPPAVSVEIKASSEVESYDIPPAPTEDNSSSEGEAYDNPPPVIPPKCKTTEENFAQQIEPPKIPPKIREINIHKTARTISGENGQFPYLDLVPEYPGWERRFTSNSGYELPRHANRSSSPSDADEMEEGKEGFEESLEKENEWDNTYCYYKSLPLPANPWNSTGDASTSSPIDMRNYTPLTINKSNSNNSLDSSISSAIGLNQYEKDTSLSYSNTKNKEESYYASLVTLSKREATARKETLLKPWYVVSIGVGHIDLRKKFKKENKTLEFFRSLSVSASNSHSANHKESLLIAWKVGN